MHWSSSRIPTNKCIRVYNPNLTLTCSILSCSTHWSNLQWTDWHNACSWGLDRLVSIKKLKNLKRHIFIHCPCPSLPFPSLQKYGLKSLVPLVGMPSHLLELTNWLELLLIEYIFKSTKSILWLHIIRAVLWKMWNKRNLRIFQETESCPQENFETTVSIALYWCKNILPFNNDRLNSPLLNWRRVL